MIFSIPLLLDGILALMLAITIFYCVVLYRRLAEIRSSDEAMNRLVKDFNAATERAQIGLLSLKTSCKDLGQATQERIDEARLLKDDLEFMTETGGNLADRLDDLLGNGRIAADEKWRASTDVELIKSKEPNVAGLPQSESELELIAALQRSR